MTDEKEPCADCATKDKVIEELLQRILDLKAAPYQWVLPTTTPQPYIFPAPITNPTWIVTW